MTPPLDSRGRCSVCGRVEEHKPWCARIAEWLDAQNRWVDPGCVVEGCERGHHALGMCPRHYNQSRTGRAVA